MHTNGGGGGGEGRREICGEEKIKINGIYEIGRREGILFSETETF